MLGLLMDRGRRSTLKKRWYVALVSMHHEKKASGAFGQDGESRISFPFNRNSTNGAIVVSWSPPSCFL